MKLSIAINKALDEVAYAMSEGKFYPNDIDLYRETTEFGIPHNVHTIATMYAKLVTDTSYDIAITTIENSIIDKYNWCVV